MGEEDLDHRMVAESLRAPTALPGALAPKMVYGRDEQVAEWVRRQLADDAIQGWGRMTAIGVAIGDELVAGIVFNNFRWPSIEASIAATTPRWCTRFTLSRIFFYPFRQANCSRLGASTNVKNQAVRAFLRRLGFREEGILRQASVRGDVVLYGMTPAECRWLLPDTTPQAGAADEQGRPGDTAGGGRSERAGAGPADGEYRHRADPGSPQ